jgi:hypothetical protein
MWYLLHENPKFCVKMFMQFYKVFTYVQKDARVMFK